MLRVLLVEENETLNRMICDRLNQKEYRVVGCRLAEEAVGCLRRESFDVIVSHMDMPSTAGFELLHRVREADAEIPVWHLSAQGGGQIGMDDGMIRSMSDDEVLAQTEELLNRAKCALGRRLVVGTFVMETDGYTAYWGERKIPLTKREFLLLFRMLSEPKRLFTREEWMAQFWLGDRATSARIVDVYIAKIRAKLADCDDFDIVTEHGRGYRAVPLKQKKSCLTR